MEKAKSVSTQIYSLQEFLQEVLTTLPGKELGENIIEFQRFLKDVGLGNAATINKNGGVIVDPVAIKSINLPEIVRKILNYLGGQMSTQLSNLFVRLFIDAYEEIKSSSKPAADIWLGQIMRDYGGLLTAYGIIGEFAQDIDLPPIFSSLTPGSVYLLKEERPTTGYEMIKEAGRYGFKIVCISKLEPNKVKYRYGLKNITIVWLTFVKTKAKSVNPDKLGELKLLISNIGAGSVVLLDCLKEINIVNGFEKALDFLKEVKDLCIKNRFALLISINPMTFPTEQLSALEQELKGAVT